MTQVLSGAHSERGKLFGALGVLAAGLVWSSGGLLIRATESPTWSILIWRSLSVGVAIALLLAVQHRGRLGPSFRKLGWIAPAGGFCLGLAMSAFVFSLQLTTVFNTLMMLSMSPLVAAALGWIVLREPVRRATWIAIAFAIVGILVMVWDGVETDSLLGNAFALLCSIGSASFIVLARVAQVSRAADATPCVALGGFFGALAALVMVQVEGGPVWVGWNDLALCVAMGFLQIGLGFVIYIWGARRLSAAEAALLALTEVVFGPVWVWLVFHEAPSDAALIGGLILLGAVVFQAASGLRKRRPPIGII